MAINMNKKVMKMKESNGLSDVEELRASLFLQPAGAVKNQAVAGGVGGLIGMFAARKMQQKQDDAAEGSASEMSKSYPNQPTVLAITSRGRLLCYDYSLLAGKPKSLIKEYARGDLTLTSMEKGRLAHTMKISFKDGGSKTFDVPRGGDYKAFEEAMSLM